MKVMASLAVELLRVRFLQRMVVRDWLRVDGGKAGKTEAGGRGGRFCGL